MSDVGRQQRAALAWAIRELSTKITVMVGRVPNGALRKEEQDKVNQWREHRSAIYSLLKE